MSSMTRRDFLAAGAAATPALSLAARAVAVPQDAQRPVAVSSANGMPAVSRAVERMRDGNDPLEAVVAGVNIVENDPDDTSVGYGGLPNEHGVVQLDASVMHGPTHKGGAVAALEGFRNPSRVAMEVLRRTDHVLLVGAGARAFALDLGFEDENLLTEKARQRWLDWKANLSPRDDWLDDDQRIGAARDPAAAGRDRPTGTIHCSAVDAGGDLGACTSTSGLAFKIPGRVGDSPIIGAGMFVDNAVGAAGSTGRGEAVIQSCGAYSAVRHMAEGRDPTEACLAVLKWIADHTMRHDLLEDGRPAFNVAMYALRKDGAYGAAVMHKGPKFAVHDGTKARLEQCAWLYE